MSVTIPLRTLVAFATGLAVAAIAVFVFQAWRVDAAPGDRDTTFVPITPCRLMDTRPAPFRVGTQGTFSTDDTNTIAAHGSNGNCTAIPTDAVGLSLNVTAVDATQLTFLTFWPDGTRPTASNLNPAPGEPPTPNAVTTNLSGSGSFNIYNKAGSVNVIVDINGYYTDTRLKAIETSLATKANIANVYTKTEVDALVAPLFATITDTGAVYEGISSGLIAVTRDSVGEYTLTFNRPVAKCAAVTSDVIFGETRDVSADNRIAGPNKILVVVRGETQAKEDTYFSIIVQCPPVTAAPLTDTGFDATSPNE